MQQHCDGDSATVTYDYTKVVTGKGQSGAALYYEDPNSKEQKIIGVHSGNQGVLNYGCFINFNMFLDFILPTLNEFQEEFGKDGEKVKSREKKFDDAFKAYQKAKEAKDNKGEILEALNKKYEQHVFNRDVEREELKMKRDNFKL